MEVNPIRVENSLLPLAFQFSARPPAIPLEPKDPAFDPSTTLEGCKRIPGTILRSKTPEAILEISIPSQRTRL